MFGIGFPELLIILVIVFLIFGAGKLPEVMGQLGKSVNAFKSGANEANTVAKKATAKKSPAKKVAAKKPMLKAKRRKA